MLLYFFITFSIYYILVGIFILGWKRIPSRQIAEDDKPIPFVSVIVAVRNEENNLSNFFECLLDQTMPKDQFEIIIVNDNSEDGTTKIIEKFMNSKGLNLRLINSDLIYSTSISPKKYALAKGISKSRGKIIVMTDGDCWFGSDWIKSLINPFQDEKVKFVSGPVVLACDNNTFSKIQCLEFVSLMGTGAAVINLKYPLLCNGANLAFRKSAYNQVNGYEGNIEYSSGDDVFLMQKIHNAFKYSIAFVKHQDAIVRTKAQPTLHSLIHQRKRWASKWNKHLLPFSWALPLFLFVHYITLIISFAYLIYDPKIYWHTGVLIILKIILDRILLKNVVDFCKLRFSNWIFFLSELMYPFYTLFFGIVVHFGSYSWKGRSFKN